MEGLVAVPTLHQALELLCGKRNLAGQRFMRWGVAGQGRLSCVRGVECGTDAAAQQRYVSADRAGT